MIYSTEKGDSNMKTGFSISAYIGLVLVGFASIISAGETLSYLDLVNRITDLEALSVPPEPGEKCQLFSSYDRASKYDEKSGKYVSWDANGDGGGIVCKEGELSVFAEMEGPGVIWRIWSASTGNGHVKIFLDGATEPAVDLPFTDYYSGKVPPFNYKSLCYKTAANGFNNFIPIPFQKSCKIVAEPNWGNYYQFNYTTYPKDTVLPTFKMDLSEEERAALAKADNFFKDGLGSDPAGKREGERTEEVTLELHPHSTSTACELTGARAITVIWVKPDPIPAADDIDTLREISIKITWDDDKTASVWAPLGDFFGTAPSVNEYRSLPLGMTKDGFYSFWYMPFAGKAKLELSNDGNSARKVGIRITHAPLSKAAAKLLRFHAKWHREALLPTEPERKIDWTLLTTSGIGRFVGIMLHIWNPVGGWWGEGDEKFFVDGEKFPSTLGTGSEDYFGYAWSSAGLFQQALHAQTRNGGDNYGHISVNRWHIADNIPFHNSFDGYIEKYFPNSGTQYAATAYFYQASGEEDPYTEQPLSERTGYYVEIMCVPDAIEGEKAKIIERSGNTRGQAMAGFTEAGGGQWSAGQQLFWTDAKMGEHLVLALPVKENGRYKLSVRMTKASDYGIVQVLVDGAKIGDPLDLFAPKVSATDMIELGAVELAPGEHKLSFEIVGINPENKSGKAFAGIDCFKIEPVK